MLGIPLPCLLTVLAIYVAVVALAYAMDVLTHNVMGGPDDE